MTYDSSVIAGSTAEALTVQRNYVLQCGQEVSYKIFVQVAKNLKTWVLLN